MAECTSMNLSETEKTEPVIDHVRVPKKVLKRVKTYPIVILCIFAVSAMYLSRNDNLWRWQPEARLTHASDTIAMHVLQHDIERRRLPDVIIAGVRKSGTHALKFFLGIHPHVKAASGEVHYFDRSKHYKEGLDWYIQQMPISHTNQLTVEMTPGIFTNTYTIKRIRKFNSSIKLLLVVRDPVERAISGYTQHVLYKPNDKILSRGPRQVFLDPDSGEVDIKCPFVERSVYIKYYKKWLRTFSKDQMYFVSAEGIVDNPLAELAGVQDFLGIKRLITEKDIVFNESKGFYCKWSNGTEHCLSKQKGRPHLDIPEDIISKLRDYYDTYNEQFYHAVGRDFGWKTY